MRWARIRATEAGLAALPQVAAELGASPDVVDRLRDDYQEHLDDIRAPRTEENVRQGEASRRLRLEVLEHKRREINRLRDANEIDDAVHRQVQAGIDIEEVRLLGPEPED